MKREDPANLQSQASPQSGDLVEKGRAKARDRALAGLRFRRYNPSIAMNKAALESSDILTIST